MALTFFVGIPLMLAVSAIVIWLEPVGDEWTRDPWTKQ